MNREQLDQRNTATIRRHYRQLTDNGGQPPQQLLDELARIADRHADDVAQACADAAADASGTPLSDLPPPPAPARTAPRRTAARRSVK